MADTMLLVILPYVAIIACVLGSVYRIRYKPLTYSSLSSQFLEPKGLMWGSLPWHLGIIAILLAHIVAFLAPGFWQNMLSNFYVLIAIETAGFALSILCLFGLLVLAVRRMTSAKLQTVTSVMDLVVLMLLFAQIGLGALIAAQHRWGAQWATHTTVPYIWSIFTLHPDTTFVVDLPIVVKAHIVGAWLFILIIPFSRLIHMFAVPVEYLFRPPQNVVWATSESSEAHYVPLEKETARRHFIRAGLGITFGFSLLAIGAADKIFKFFFGPRLSKHDETELLEERLAKLETTVGQRKLELERQSSNYILVCPLSELNETKGKYFIDYLMRPAIAFKGEDGLPLLISAKCTHLGCTVGNDVTDGKILCPCHISYFDIKTGQPNAGAPAKEPLPHLGWVLINEQGKVLMSREPDGKTTGTLTEESRLQARVYIAKNHEEKA